MNQMPQGLFCQSCSMPLNKPQDFGTNADGSKSEEYCCYCYQKGKFTEPNITMYRMIEKVARMMAEMQHIPEDSAMEMCVHFIPKLSRWRK